MGPIVAVIAPGAMGSAVARCLTGQGVEVRTLLTDRTGASGARAEAAGMRATDEAGIASADFVLSIVPPAVAVGLAERLVPALTRAARKPVYVDCNAISPATMARVAAILAPTGCAVVDAGIIGPAPAPPGSTCPAPRRRGSPRWKPSGWRCRCWTGRSAPPRR